MASPSNDRSSRAIEKAPRQQLTDGERDRKVLENNLIQFDRMMELIDEGLKSEFFRLQSWMVLDLNRRSIDGLIDNPGLFRQTPIVIDGSKHQPPPWEDVPKHVDLMCSYINENWKKSPVHLASYVMWRLNWIHPFADGNGRTSRAVSYMVLSVRLGQRIPGKTTIPDRIAAKKEPYYEALEAADRSLSPDGGKFDLSKMEHLLSGFLRDQVMDAAQSELPRGSKERQSSVNKSDPLRKSFYSEHKTAIIGGLFLILAAIIGGACTLLSTDPGQRLLMPKRQVDNSTGTVPSAPK